MITKYQTRDAQGKDVPGYLIYLYNIWMLYKLHGGNFSLNLPKCFNAKLDKNHIIPKGQSKLGTNIIRWSKIHYKLVLPLNKDV